MKKVKVCCWFAASCLSDLVGSISIVLDNDKCLVIDQGNYMVILS